MSLLSVLIAIVVVGVVLWAVNTYVPLDPKIRRILNIVIVLVLVIWLLKAFGVWGAIAGVTL